MTSIALLPLLVDLVVSPFALGGLPIRPVLPDGLGVNIHFTDPQPGEMKMLTEGGFRWIRMDILWATTEPEQGRYDFTAYDRLVAALEAHRLRPLLILCYSNKLYDQGKSPCTEEGRMAFARWAAAAVQRYRGRGIVWEIYNEPNARGFWSPEVNVQDYIKLALTACREIRAVTPDEVMVGPAVAGTDAWFLEECFRAGLLEYWSAVTVHPYRSSEPETVAERYRALRRLIAHYASKTGPIPILAGEWGYATGGRGVSEEEQGKLLPRQWLTNLANDVPISIWYDWHDDGPNPDEKEHNWGTVRHAYHGGRDPVYDPKPAYRAAKALTSVLDGFRFNKRLAVGGASDYVLLFDRGDDVRLAAWTTWPVPSEVTVPASPGRFRVTAHTGESLPALVAGPGGLTLTLTDAPQYLAAECPNDGWRVAGAWERLPLEGEQTASQQITLETGFRNPLGGPITFRTASGGHGVVSPGQEVSLSTTVDLTGKPGVVLGRVEWQVQDMGTLAQETQIVWTPVGSTELQRKFAKPPDDAKPMVRWWWFGPAVNNQEIEREIRFMKDGGFGGFQLDTVYPMTMDEPAKGLVNSSYLAREHLESVGFAAATARQHGMRMDVTLGSGWPYGGPHIPVEQAAGRLRIHRVDVEPGTTVVPVPGLKPGERLIAAFAGPGTKDRFAAAELRAVTDLHGDFLRLAACPDRRVVIFFSAGRTFMMVKRAAVGAEGYVLDHFNRAALENHLATVGEKLLAAAGPGMVRAVFCDSLEVIGSDWASDGLEEFHRRRGYDLKPFLPALVADIGEQTAAVRHDYGQTLSELFTERFLEPLQQWCRRHNVLLRLQPYGMPGPGLFSLAYVDLPEGESPNWNGFSCLRWVSSASHIYGRPVTSSETWTWAHPPMFRATPLDLKSVADLHFLEGVNQLIGHGWPYSPEQAGLPGWTFYATVVLNRANPWWPVMPDLTQYLTRVSLMMRQGQPVNDVAVYAPTDDAWALSHSIWVEQKPLEIALPAYIGARLGSSIVPRLLEAGYNFDLVDDTVINQLGRIEHGSLAVSGLRYRVIVLPSVERIPLATLKRLAEFVRQGGLLLSTRRLPGEAPGLTNRAKTAAEITTLARELFEGPSARAHFVRDEEQVGKELGNLYPPDVVLSPVTPSVGFVHRRVGESEVYFIANTSNMRRTVRAGFRVEGLEPQWWDPLTGAVTEAEVRTRTKGRTEMQLDLEPHGSRILVFGKGTGTPAAARKRQTSERVDPLDISGGWHVVFEDGRKQVVLATLRSWTEDDDTRFFSGQATYCRKVSAPVELLRDDVQVKLDFGEPTPVTMTPAEGLRAGVEGPVREAAEVSVNGVGVGMVWHPPYEVDVTGVLRSGANEIKVTVANLLINRLANSPRPGGTLSERLSYYRELNARYGVRFHPEDLRDLQPLPAGLLGPVRLVPGRRLR